MATITLRAQKGAPLTFAEVDNNFNAINQELSILAQAAALKGEISNADIAAGAGIVDTKLATISSTGKVANSATTASSANTGNAIVLRDASGNFSAGTITAALAGNASTATQLAGNRTISLTGAVTGSVTSDFSGNVTLATTLASESVTNSSISPTAGIVDSKLATISAANKVAASAVDIDGASDIGQPLPNEALFLVDRTGAGENRKASITRIPAYVFSKISGDVVIDQAGVATVTPAGKVDATDVFAQVSGDITISPTGVAALAAGSVFNAEISASAAIAHSKLASLLAGQVLLGNSSNVPTGTAISGDITLSPAGVAAIQPGVIRNAAISSDANIAFSKLAPLAPGQLLIGNASSVAAGVAITGDVAISSSGVATLKASIALSGQPTTTTPALTSNSSQLATTAYVVDRIAQDAPGKNGLGASGSNWNIGITGNAATATRLAATRLINGVPFDGTQDITIPTNALSASVSFTDSGLGDAPGAAFDGTTGRTVSFNTIGAASATGSNVSGNSWNIGILGNAATATKLRTARTINGVTFDGSSSITLNASTPNALTFTSNGSGAASGTSFNGASAITISHNTIGAQPLLGFTPVQQGGGIDQLSSKIYIGMGAGGLRLQVDTTDYATSWPISVTGNAATATALAQGRTITLSGDVAGVSGSFNGSANASISTALANTGVTAATYNYASFTVDAKGRITQASNGLQPTSAPTPNTLVSRDGSGLTSVAALVAGGIEVTGAVVPSCGLFRPALNTLGFSTAGVERLRVNSDGRILLGQSATITPGAGNVTTGIGVLPVQGALYLSRQDQFEQLGLNSNTASGDAPHVSFFRSGLFIGSIYSTPSQVFYGTTSDYRLKQDVSPVTDCLARVSALNPVRFRFKAEPGSWVDGFLAHEVQGIVPGAVTGSKDGTNPAGRPIYQQIDYTKLIPLLTGGLREIAERLQRLEAAVL